MSAPSAHQGFDVDPRRGVTFRRRSPRRSDEGLAGDPTALSSLRIASGTTSEIWSAILSGWPSETDSEVNNSHSP